MVSSMEEGFYLNDLLKGINMGIKTFVMVKENVSSQDLRKLIDEIIQGFNRQKDKLVDIINDLGVKVDNKLPLFGRISSAYENLKLTNIKDDFSIVIFSIDAISMGIKQTSVFLHENKKNVSSYLDIIHSIQNDYEVYLHKLKHYIKT